MTFPLHPEQLQHVLGVVGKGGLRFEHKTSIYAREFLLRFGLHESLHECRLLFGVFKRLRVYRLFDAARKKITVPELETLPRDLPSFRCLR